MLANRRNVHHTWRYCGVFVILAPYTKLQTNLLPVMIFETSVLNQIKYY